MYKRPPREELLRALWQASVFDVVGREASDASEKELLALEALAKHRRAHAQALEIHDERMAIESFGHGRAVWMLLSLEAAGWLGDIPGRLSMMAAGDEQKWQGKEGVALVAQLTIGTDAISHVRRRAFDVVPLMLPRWLFVQLRDAMAALMKGEVHPIVMPRTDGRHQPWTRDELRTRALEHVFFLRGQKFTTKEARSLVAAATGISSGTLRDWELELRKADARVSDRWEAAKAAGDFKRRRAEDPNYCKGDGNWVDDRALASFEAMLDEPLAVFGRFYKEHLGNRHWGAGK